MQETNSITSNNIIISEKRLVYYAETEHISISIWGSERGSHKSFRLALGNGADQHGELFDKRKRQ